MNLSPNLLLLDYALGSLVRHKGKMGAVAFLLSLIVALLSSVLIIADAIKYELSLTLGGLPEMTLQRFVAGKQVDIPVERVEALLELQGVERVSPRVWGYYYFKPAGVNFSVVGIDPFEPFYSERIEQVTSKMDITLFQQHNAMVVGRGVQAVLAENYYKEFFNFVTPDGKWERVKIAGVFSSDVLLESNDLILLPKSLAYKVLGMEEGKATDIVLRVANPLEIPTLVKKIGELYPDVRVVTKDDIRVSYHNVFDYKSGFFLAVFSVCALAFFIVVFDRLSGVSSQERREIGILKAVGWSLDDIIKAKFYESGIVAFGAFMVGLSVALFFVYGLHAPLLRGLFTGYSALKPSFILPFHLNVSMVVLLFFMSVPVYIAATLIPVWKIATLDADEVMR